MITIRQYDKVEDAYLAKSLLESEEVPAYVADEYLVNVNWMWSQAIGGVKLQVAEEDVERALEILEAPPDGVLLDEQGQYPGELTPEHTFPVCPKCGGHEVDESVARRAFVYLGLLLFRVPVPVRVDVLRCRSCGHQARAREFQPG